jgi:hypothetical protein
MSISAIYDEVSYALRLSIDSFSILGDVIRSRMAREDIVTLPRAGHELADPA